MKTKVKMTIAWVQDASHPGVPIDPLAVVALAAPQVTNVAALGCTSGAFAFEITNMTTALAGASLVRTSSANLSAPWTLHPPNPLPKKGVPVDFTLQARCDGAGSAASNPGQATGLLTAVVTSDGSWKGFCPEVWPPALPTTLQIAVTARFASGPLASCKSSLFPLAAKKASTYVAQALTRGMRSFVLDPNAESEGANYNNIAQWVVKGTGVSVCKDAPAGSESFGTVQTIVEINGLGVGSTSIGKGSYYYQQYAQGVTTAFHLADLCPNATAKPYPLRMLAEIYNQFCSAAGGGERLAAALLCMRNPQCGGQYQPSCPPAYRAPGACFPGDATMTKADPVTGRSLGPARMSDLAIGDAVQCLVPSEAPARLRGLRDDEQAYVPGVCRVFGAMDVDPAVDAPFVALHYIDASGSPAKLRASAEHLVYLAPAQLPPPGTAELPPGGFARRADMVRVGDLLAVRAVTSPGGDITAVDADDISTTPRFYTARVTAVTTERHAGIYAPLLTNAGLPLVDGAAAFSWAHIVRGSDPHPMQNLGEYYRHVRFWMDLQASIDSGCSGQACPCLDAPEDPARRCTRLGDRLAELPLGKSDFTARSYKLLLKGLAEGRTFFDYGGAIPLGQAYERHPWLWRAARALPWLKPHTLGLLASDRFLKRDPTLVSPPPRVLGGQ